MRPRGGVPPAGPAGFRVVAAAFLYAVTPHGMNPVAVLSGGSPGARGHVAAHRLPAVAALNHI